MGTRSLRRRTLAVLAVGLVLASCGDRSGKTLADPIFDPPAPPMPASTLPLEPTLTVGELQLIAPWVDGAEIPARHTCNDVGVSPALTWTNVPLGTVELALAVRDLEAVGAIHWLIAAIPAGSTGMTEATVPDGAFQLLNSAGEAAWLPPCPPPGETHRYEFSLYALNQQLEAADDADVAEVINLLDSTTVVRSAVTGVVTG